MACNSCAKSFSLLRKEKGCPGCGFSYCSKCLENKIFIPKLNSEAKVCSKCSRAASNPNQTKTVVEPPDAYYKRLGLTDPKAPIKKSVEGKIDTKDQHIMERLQKLKEDRNAPPPATTDEDIRNRLLNIKGEMPSTSDAEIQARLAKLRGVPIETITSKPVLLPPDTRSEQEQADDLLKQYLEVTTIDSKYKDEFDGLVNDMESRIKKLRENDASGVAGQVSEKPEAVESEDEEEAVKKIVQKIKAEASFEDNEIGPTTDDELPFCEICNEDATMRCLGCRYLFCKRCFHDHKDDDDGCNRYEPYRPPKNV